MVKNGTPTEKLINDLDMANSMPQEASVTNRQKTALTDFMESTDSDFSEKLVSTTQLKSIIEKIRIGESTHKGVTIILNEGKTRGIA